MNSYNDICVCCGRYVPEGRQVCPVCEGNELDNPKSEIQYAFLRLRLSAEETASKILEALAEVAARISEMFKKLWENLKILLFGSGKYKKILHLAKYGKKARTRKKNTSRLIRLLERGRYKPG